jgi:hypothetical protein
MTKSAEFCESFGLISNVLAELNSSFNANKHANFNNFKLKIFRHALLYTFTSEYSNSFSPGKKKKKKTVHQKEGHNTLT